MLEFTSTSVSTYESASLTSKLEEMSADGWKVEGIVPAGTDIVAYLSRPRTAAASTSSAAPSTSEASAATAATSDSSDGEGWGMKESSVPEAAESGASAATAPAGWYADPSRRFELRYWNGTKWTEHVSRGGQQSTDPPVA